MKRRFKLEVPRRWFPADRVDLQKAKYLDLILYSREQLTKEYFDMPDKKFSNSQPDVPWGIISIKPQARIFMEIIMYKSDLTLPALIISVA